MGKPIIAFVLNQAKSEFYHAWGEGLERAGTSVFYISPSPRWTQWLKERSVPASRILTLHDAAEQWQHARPLTRVEVDLFSRIEAAGPLTVSSMIQMDRALKQWKPNRAAVYAATIANLITKFLESSQISMVLGETTWLVELLTAQIAAANGKTFFAPSTARIPSEKLLFFKGPVQRSYQRFNDASAEDIETAHNRIVDLQEQKSQPYYMGLKTGRSHVLQHLLSEALHHLGNLQDTKKDISVLPLKHRISRILGNLWRTMSTGLLIKFDTPPPRSQKPYIYVTLHQQPEASIDILGAPYDNQLETIRALSRLLPVGYELWAKEHRSAIGARSVSWYKKIKNIPGVRLISPHCDGFAIMQAAELTCSPAGTVCYEAGLLGLRSTSFAPMFYDPVQTLPSFCPYAASYRTVETVLTTSPPTLDERISFLADIIANSFDARIGDPVSDPSCMNNENIDSLVSATHRIVQAL